MTDDFDRQFDDKVRAREAGLVDEQLRLALPEPPPLPPAGVERLLELAKRINASQDSPILLEIEEPYESEAEQAVAIETAQRRDGRPDNVFTEQDYLDQIAGRARAQDFDLPLPPLIDLADLGIRHYRAEAVQKAAPKITIAVYLKNGTVREYDVTDAATAREHAHEIIQTGYRSVDRDVPNVLVHWPPHEIKKVKLTANFPIQTNYFDRVRGT